MSLLEGSIANVLALELFEILSFYGDLSAVSEILYDYRAFAFLQKKDLHLPLFSNSPIRYYLKVSPAVSANSHRPNHWFPQRSSRDCGVG